MTTSAGRSPVGRQDSSGVARTALRCGGTAFPTRAAKTKDVAAVEAYWKSTLIENDTVVTTRWAEDPKSDVQDSESLLDCEKPQVNSPAPGLLGSRFGPTVCRHDDTLVGPDGPS